MIKKVERLRGDGADVALAHRGIDVAEVERLEKLQPLVPKGRHIDAAARVGEPVAVLDVLRAGGVGIDIAGLRDVRPADLQLQRAARGEDAVADLLGIEAAAAGVRKEPVLGIARTRRGDGELPRRIRDWRRRGLARRGVGPEFPPSAFRISPACRARARRAV